MEKQPKLYQKNLSAAKNTWGALSSRAEDVLDQLTSKFAVSVASGDIIQLDGSWYITHSGLLNIAHRNRCHGIHSGLLRQFCDPPARRWVFKATVYTRQRSRGFVGYGDADPSNVSEAVRGAEMRVAETRAVNRALRKAYGVGICSVEEIAPALAQPERTPVGKKAPCGHLVPSSNVNGNARPRLRDRLRQLIRQHQLDPILVKSYAIDFCGTKTLADASREQIQDFVGHLARRAATDRDALVSELNRYVQPQERAS